MPSIRSGSIERKVVFASDLKTIYPQVTIESKEREERERLRHLRIFLAELASKFGEQGNMFLYGLSNIVDQTKGTGLSKQQVAKIFYNYASKVAPQITYPKLNCERISTANRNTPGIILNLQELINDYLDNPKNSREMLAKLLRIKAALLLLET